MLNTNLEPKFTDRWLGVRNANEINIMIIKGRCNFKTFDWSRFCVNRHCFTKIMAIVIDDARICV